MASDVASAAKPASLEHPARLSVLAVRDLTKRFDAFTAVDAISFDVREGEVFAFLRPNGAGKSTTINMLCTLARPSSGHLTIAGIDVVARPQSGQAAHRARLSGADTR